MTLPPPRILITGKPGVGKTTIIRKVLEELRVPYGGFYTEEIREGGARVGFRLRSTDGKVGIMAHINSKSPHRVSKYGVEVSAFEDIAVPELDRVLHQYLSPYASRAEKKGGHDSLPPGIRGEQEGGHADTKAGQESIPPYGSSGENKGGQAYFPPGFRGEFKGGALLVIDELGRMELFSRKFQDKVMEVFDHPIPILAVIQDSKNPFLDKIRTRKDVTLIRVTPENRDRLVGEIFKKLGSLSA